MKKILIATRNQDKTKEIEKIFTDLGLKDFKVVNLDNIEINKNFDVKETGETFEDNAILKARSFGAKAQMMWPGSYPRIPEIAKNLRSERYPRTPASAPAFAESECRLPQILLLERRRRSKIVVLRKDTRFLR